MNITINHLNKSYGPKKVLRDFSAMFPQGQTTVIMGPSGCGKTTLLNILMNFTKPDSGSIHGLPDKIAAVFQEDRLCDDFSALCNVSMVLNAPSTVPAQLLAQLGLGDALHKPVKALSGGMKRRVAIARALCYDPQLLILDEPFKGLDDATRRVVISVVQKYTSDKTVIAVTHDPEEAAILSDNIIKMEATP